MVRTGAQSCEERPSDLSAPIIYDGNTEESLKGLVL